MKIENTTTPSKAQHPIDLEALEDLGLSKRALSQLEALLYSILGQDRLDQHTRTMIDIGWNIAADAANTASCAVEKLEQQIGAATQNANSEIVSRHVEVQP